MAPKTNCNPIRLQSIITYMQKSRVAHTIKDLEKHLPSVASISGMQVKDYIQNLQDENKIRVEKIGSGNWYWSFASEEKKVQQRALEDAQATHDKCVATNEELEGKLAEAAARRQDDEDMLDQGGESREELIAAKAVLEGEVMALQKELAAYSDNDPVELGRKIVEVEKCKAEAATCTDDILAMEMWFKEQIGGGEGLEAFRMEYYQGEYDEEEKVLRELP